MQENTKEMWKPVLGYENLYEVSNLGKVRSLDRLVRRGTGVMLLKGQILKPEIDNKGYLRVDLYKDEKHGHFKIHRLVAREFPEICGQYAQDFDVEHKNCIPTDNRAENLRWCTHKENCGNELSRQHYSESKKGEKHPMWGKFGKLNSSSKPIIQYSLNGEKLAEFDSLHDVERKLGIWHQNIIACCKGRLKTTGGFIFKYKQ